MLNISGDSSQSALSRRFIGAKYGLDDSSWKTNNCRGVYGCNSLRWLNKDRKAFLDNFKFVVVNREKRVKTLV